MRPPRWLHALRSYRRRRKGLTLRQEIALTTFRNWSAKRRFKPGAEERIRSAAGQLTGPRDMGAVIASIRAIVASELAD